MDNMLTESYRSKILHSLKTKNIEDFRELFLELHPTDQVEIFKIINKDLRKSVYQSLSPAEFAEIFQGIDFKWQKSIQPELDEPYIAEMFNNMYADDVADFLEKIELSNARRFLSLMGREEAKEVEELLAYPNETAGAIMTTEFIVTRAEETVAELMERLRREGPEAETIYYLYVVDSKEKLVGVISLRDLIISRLEQRIEDIMSTHVISVSVLTDQEEAANIIKDYNFLALPVIDSHGVLVGIVTVDDVLDVLEDETTEDIGNLSAVKGAVNLEMPSGEAAKKRLPWLILLLFIGMITAGIIGSFEETLEEVAILAIFIPLVAGMAGNTGTQSLAVVVRGLALGKFDRAKVIHLIRREAGTGLIMGTACGIIVTFISQFVTGGNVVLGFIVGFSLFCTLIVSTLSGATVPLVINRLKIDPAVASGPFITTINDIIGLLIYFSIATALIDYL